MAQKELKEDQSGVVVFIPAFKKSSFFQDDLLRKLDGVPLIQRAINKALALGIERTAIHVLTDSEEVHLLATRAAIGTFLDPKSDWNAQALGKEGRTYISHAEDGKSCSVVLSVYAPLLQVSTLRRAISELENMGAAVLRPVRLERGPLYDDKPKALSDLVFSGNFQSHYLESRAFSILRPGLLGQQHDEKVPADPFSVGEDTIEIESLRTWWVCEKLLQRRRILFRVIGNDTVGLGHVYRSLSLAHEMTDHEVLFVTDPDNDLAALKLADSEYWTGVYPKNQIVDRLVELTPDLVVLDMLDTLAADVDRLHSYGIAVASFEDLGSGSRITNLTVNELYDHPKLSGSNYRWGKEYFFVRDEFNTASPGIFRNDVQALLLTFGGTDQHNLSKCIFTAIRDVCAQNGIHVHIVTGPGYRRLDELRQEIGETPTVTLIHSTGIISGVMEQCDLAITSNGRTVYELAHMNIPAVVIDQHERENTHHFANEKNGFLATGLYRPGETEVRVRQLLMELLKDGARRRSLFDNTIRHSFLSAKQTIAKDLISLARNTTARLSI